MKLDEYDFPYEVIRACTKVDPRTVAAITSDAKKWGMTTPQYLGMCLMEGIRKMESEAKKTGGGE